MYLLATCIFSNLSPIEKMEMYLDTAIPLLVIYQKIMLVYNETCVRNNVETS